MGSYLTVASRFCRYRVPAGWTVAGRGAAFDDRPTAVACSAVATECWIDPPLPAREVAAKQLAFARQTLAELAVVREGPATSLRFPEAWLAVLRAKGPDGTPLLQHQLTVAAGSLACFLTLSGAERDTDRWATLFANIAESLEIPALEVMSRLIRRPLLSATPATGGPTALLSDIQLLVPVPEGWSVDSAAQTLRGPGAAELRVRAATPVGVSLDEAFADALARLAHSPELQLRSWDCGELDGGRRWYAVEAHQAKVRTWGRTEERVVLQLLVEDEEILDFDLVAEPPQVDAAQAMAAVVGGMRRPAASERKLRLPVPWLPAILEGAWRQLSEGLFVHLEPPQQTVVVRRQDCPRGLRRLAEAALGVLASDPGTGQVIRQELVEGSWKGTDAVRCALDAISPGGRPAALRAAWLRSDGEAAHFLVQGADAEAVDRLFVRLLEAVEPGQLKGVSRQ